MNTDHMKGVKNRQLYKSLYPSMMLLRSDASIRIRKLLEERSLAITAVGNEIGVDPGWLSKTLQGQFTLRAPLLVRFANDVLKMSVHQVLFDTKGVTMLPKTLSNLVNILLELSQEEREAYFKEATDIFHQYERPEEEEIPYAITYERTGEIATDLKTSRTEICGYDAHGDFKAVMTKLTPDDSYEPRITPYLFMTWYFDTTMDYFLVRDYTKFTDIAYKDGKTRKRKVVKNKKIIRFVSQYLRSEEKGQEMMAGRLLAAEWR